MIRNIIAFSKLYKYELLLTICLFSNLYPQLPGYFYYVSVAGIAMAMYKMKARKIARTGLVLALIIFMLFSALLAGPFNTKAISMAVILFITLAYSSEEFYRFKFTFMYISLIAYAFTSIINFYAKRAGINFYDGMMTSIW